MIGSYSNPPLKTGDVLSNLLRRDIGAPERSLGGIWESVCDFKDV
jgi:hypothetical protein